MTPQQHEKLTKIRHKLLDAWERKDDIDIGFGINDLDNFLYNNQPVNMVVKRYDIDFDGNVLAGIEIYNSVPKIYGAMNGYGNGIDMGKITITPKP